MIANISSTNNIQQFFVDGLSITLTHWREVVETAEIGIIDQDRENMLKAIRLSLSEGGLWESAYSLMTTLTAYIERRGLWAEWAIVLGLAVEAGQKFGTDKQAMQLYHHYGRALLPLNRYSQGEAAYLKAVKLAQKVGDKTTEARACSNLGYYYIDRGHWWRCEVLCGHALNMFSQMDNAHGQAHTRNHLGLLYTRQRRWREAEQHLKAACDIWEHNRDSYGLMLGYMNLGVLYHDMRDGRMCIHWSNNALRCAGEIEDRRASGVIRGNIGAAYLVGKQYEKAKTHLVDAIDISYAMNDILNIGRAKTNLAEAYLETGEIEASASLFEEGIGILSAIGNTDGLISTASYLLAATTTAASG